MAYEQRPKAKTAKVREGVTTVRIEKSGDLGLTNKQLLDYKGMGFEIKDEGYVYTATISTAKRDEQEREAQSRGLRQVLGTRQISNEDRAAGQYLSSVEELPPLRAEQLAQLGEEE